MLGGSGFIGRAILERLHAMGVAIWAPSSSALNLANPQAVEMLASLLQPTDTLIFTAALTPDRGRDIGNFMTNLQMGACVCKALSRVKPNHVIYFSSDAVYPFSLGKTDEQSPAAPTDLYGVMHRSRELMLEHVLRGDLCILRPTMVYGSRDTHNAYGPNRFRRQAQAEQRIAIAGNGEETRDHVFIDDVVELTVRVMFQRSHGVLNLATGMSCDFGTVARQVAEQFDHPIEIVTAPRTRPITHRVFDSTAVTSAFPGFVFTSLSQGLALTHRGS